MYKTIAIFGGTFSPPHLGHMKAAEAFLEAIQPDKLLIIPAAIPPHKELCDGATALDRAEMCRLAFDHLPNTEISLLELERGGKSYTADTLSDLSEEGTRLAFLCGTDMMLTLDEWYDPERIFALADLYCIRREDDPDVLARMNDKNEQYERRFGKRVTFLSTPVCEISSTEIRLAIGEGRASAYLAPAVAAYIEKRGLYR